MVVRKDWWESIRGKRGDAEKSKVEKACGLKTQTYDGSRSADSECNESAGTPDEEKLNYYKPRRRPTNAENQEALEESNSHSGRLLGQQVRTDGEKGKAWRKLQNKFEVEPPGWKMNGGHCRKHDCGLKQSCETMGLKTKCASCKRKGTATYLKPGFY